MASEDDEDEAEEEAGEETTDNDYVELTEGTVAIFDTATFQARTGALAVHVTLDNGVYILDGDTLEWKAFPVSGKRLTAVAPIKKH